METEEQVNTVAIRLRGAKSAFSPLLPEIDCYLHLLVLVYLKDLGQSSAEAAVRCADNLVKVSKIITIGDLFSNLIAPNFRLQKWLLTIEEVLTRYEKPFYFILFCCVLMVWMGI